jgi:hypothetical protein
MRKPNHSGHVFNTKCALLTGGAHGGVERSLKTLALDALALHLTSPADRFRGFARPALGWLFVMAAKLHFAEHALALELLFERFQRLVDVIVTNENLHLADNSFDSRLKQKHGATRGSARHRAAL